MHVSSPKDHQGLLKFFLASRQEKDSTWWRMADFKIELIRRILPKTVAESVLAKIKEQKKIADRQKALYSEDPEHQDELAELKTQHNTIASEIESELCGHVLLITNENIVAAFRHLGWDA